MKSAAKLVQTERKNKFYLIFSEVQPNFCSRSELEVVQTERKNKITSYPFNHEYLATLYIGIKGMMIGVFLM